MSATSLRCRSCAAEYTLEDIGTCTACFGPLDPVYDWGRLARTVTREASSAGMEARNRAVISRRPWTLTIPIPLAYSSTVPTIE